MRARPPIPALLWVALVAQLAARTAAACDPATAPTALTRSAEEWMAEAPRSVRAALDARGLVFPGRTVPGEALGRLCPEMTPAVVLFDDPPSEVFGLLIQTGRHGEFMSHLGAMEPVSRAPGDHVDRHEIRILFTRLIYHPRHHWDATGRRIWWDLSPNHRNDFARIEGYWELHPLGEARTLGFYGTTIDLGSAIPKRFQASLTARNMRTAVDNIRRWVSAQAGGGR